MGKKHGFQVKIMVSYKVPGKEQGGGDSESVVLAGNGAK